MKMLSLFHCNCHNCPALLFLAVCILLLAFVTAQGNDNLNCDFNKGPCSWTNVHRGLNIDDFNWKIGKRAQGMQKGSGTYDDHGGGGGYMFIKSRKGRGNRTAMLLSPSFSRSSPFCFSFWYFMKGRSMGRLAVLQTNNITHKHKMLWNLKGHQGSDWKNAKIPLPPVRNIILIIEALDLDLGKSGNILLDDITVTPRSANNSCLFEPPSAKPIFSATTASPATTTTVSTVATSGVVATQVLQDSTSVATVHYLNSSKSSTTLVQVPTAQSPAENPVTSSELLTTQLMLWQNSSVFTEAGLNATELPHGPYTAVQKSSIQAVWLVLGVLIAISVFVVVLVILMRRRRKPQSMYADDCSVTITRMYPNINPPEQRVEYHKLV